MSLKYTPVTDKECCADLFNVYSNHAPLNNSGQELAVFNSDIPVTLK